MVGHFTNPPKKVTPLGLYDVSVLKAKNNSPVTCFASGYCLYYNGPMHNYGCSHTSHIDPANTTPMVRQFLQVKNEYPGVLLLYQMGDFYETFFEDALLAHKVLDITLTARDAGGIGKIPMAGIPIKAAEAYLPKLLQQQLKVAICEQSEDPNAATSGGAKGLVTRQVVRILSGGTLTDGPMLPSDAPNRLAALVASPKKSAISKADGLPAITPTLSFGLAWCDVSTGQFAATEVTLMQLSTMLEALAPKELLIPGQYHRDKTTGVTVCQPLPTLQPYLDTLNIPPTPVSPPSQADKLLCEVLSIHSLDSTGLQPDGLPCQAAALIAQALKTQFPQQLPVFEQLQVVNPNQTMVLPANTRRNLELFETVRHRQVEGSLFGVLNTCQSPMGTRLLRDWLALPLTDVFELEARLNTVEWLVEHPRERQTLRGQLAEMTDLGRLAQKVAQASITPRELIALAATLGRLPALTDLLKNVDVGAFYLLRLSALPEALMDMTQAINTLLLPTPAPSVKDGPVCRSEANTTLLELNKTLQTHMDWLGTYEAEERERTGLKGLKVLSNGAFGYFIEIPRAQAKQAPADYTRKQTLTQAERFISPALKTVEDALTLANNQRMALEHALLMQLRQQLQPLAPLLKDVAHRLAAADVLSSFAHVAVLYGYSRPVFSQTPGLNLINARHPVLERQVPQGQYVANDCQLHALMKASDDTDPMADASPTDVPAIMLITGPNMAGKSTYMRTVALIVIMAQIGCYVPATHAQLGLVDALFTRIGAVDDLTTGQSTFMIEMQETAAILHNATPNSLILLDEVGRGTSTYDGVSIAWSVVEHLSAHLPCRTLFATHYHELNALEGRVPGVQNMRVCVAETPDGIVFLHRVEPGTAQKSYGVHVAKMAGLPRSLLTRANGILQHLQRNEGGVKAALPPRQDSQSVEGIRSPQLSLFVDT
jgi:DNA mismatch repair protein MutS